MILHVSVSYIYFFLYMCRRPHNGGANYNGRLSEGGHRMIRNSVQVGNNRNKDYSTNAASYRSDNTVGAGRSNYEPPGLYGDYPTNSGQTYSRYHGLQPPILPYQDVHPPGPPGKAYPVNQSYNYGFPVRDRQASDRNLGSYNPSEGPSLYQPRHHPQLASTNMADQGGEYYNRNSIPTHQGARVNARPWGPPNAPLLPPPYLPQEVHVPGVGRSHPQYPNHLTPNSFSALSRKPPAQSKWTTRPHDRH